MARTVNEKSPLYMTIVFTDEVDDPLIPASVDWRLDNADAATEIVGWTALGSIASTMNLTIPGSNNLITDEENVREGRILGIRVNDGTSSEAHEEFHYHVLNLQGPTGA